jgi:hypothetical protein
MRLFFAVALVWGIASCVTVEDVPLVLRLPAGESALVRYRVELWRGGTCPSAPDAFGGAGTGGALVEVKDDSPAMLGGFANVEEGDFVVFALGFTALCEPDHYGCTEFRAGSGDQVVVELGDSDWDSGLEECPGMICEASRCVPNGECDDISLSPLGSCTIPRDCGPSRAFDCTELMCVPKLATIDPLAIDVMRATRGEVIGRRFTLVEEGLDYIHVLAPVFHAPAPPSLEIWSAPSDQLMSGTVNNADTAWSLDDPFAVAAREYAGTVVAVAYDQGTPEALNIGQIDDLTLSPITPIFGSTPRSGTPAFTGTGENIRQFWYGAAPDGESRELASLSRTAEQDSARFFNGPDLPDYGANEIIGSKGDYALLESAIAGLFFLAYSEPGATGGRAPMVEPQRETLGGITSRPAFVHLGGDAYLLMFPAGGTLILREATCTGPTCVFGEPTPEPIPVGRSLRALRAEALFDSGTFEGVALAYALDDCTGSPQVELVLLDENFLPVWREVVEYEHAFDVELAVVDDGVSWRVYVAWLRNDEATGQAVSLRTYDF